MDNSHPDQAVPTGPTGPTGGGRPGPRTRRRARRVAVAVAAFVALTGAASYTAAIAATSQGPPGRAADALGLAHRQAGAQRLFRRLHRGRRGRPDRRMGLRPGLRADRLAAERIDLDQVRFPGRPTRS